jgi:beta-galactosidase
MNPTFDDTEWSRVTIPHTWNNEGDPPLKGYYRGPGWYRNSFKPDPTWKNKRVFVRFEGASLVTRAYLNGHLLGEHKGGFAAFCFELTPYLHLDTANCLAVCVDNSRREDVIPLSGDFTIFGGLYRPVTFIVTDLINITPLDHGSPGIFIHQTDVSDARAEVQVDTEISNGSLAKQKIEARLTIKDADGKNTVASAVAKTIPSKAAALLGQKVIIPHPHLWNGVADPHLYTARVELFSSGALVDAVEQPLGLRYFKFDRVKGFSLNGKPIQIHGVAKHQDWDATGWAVAEKQLDTDLALMREMGVTGVRLAHYQHNEYFYKLCDREGLLVWTELPLVNDVRGTREFLDNARQQLSELIRQNLNHPSVILWSLYNEIGPSNTNDPVPIVKSLEKLAKTEDPTRPTTGALSIDGIEKLQKVGRIQDILALNVYPGWYIGVPQDMGGIVDKWNAVYGSHGMIISEYGAGASLNQHQQSFEGRQGRAPNAWHPEEWQTLVHEANYSALRGRTNVYGSFVWNMFDFASAGRKEGDRPAVNDKGLVTRDRKVRKDAYYFYQANWTAKPMVYITSRRDTERTTSATDIRVFSNCAKVLLTVNGKHCGEVAGDDLHTFVWKAVPLQPGENVIEVEARSVDGIARDSCRWTCRASQS